MSALGKAAGQGAAVCILRCSFVQVAGREEDGLCIICALESSARAALLEMGRIVAAEIAKGL